MQLAATSGPEGIQFTDEFVYAYNGTGGAVLRGDAVTFDLEDTALSYDAGAGGITSRWCKFKTPTAIGVVSGIGGVVADVAGAASLALTKLQVRGQVVYARTTNTALTTGWGGAFTATTRNFTFAAAPVGTQKIVAILLTTGYASALADPVDVLLDGINGLR